MVAPPELAAPTACEVPEKPRPVVTPSSPSGLVPFAVCEAVSRALWCEARAQAEQAWAALANVAGDSPVVDEAEVAGGVPLPTPDEPPVKRRRVTNGGDAAAGGEQDTGPFATFEHSQISQTQSEEAALMATGASTASAEQVVTTAQMVLLKALAERGLEGFHGGCHSQECGAPRPGAAVLAEVMCRVRAMSLSAVTYWREVSQDLGRAAASLARFLEHQRRLYWRHAPWRGVNLGGWLLLEPGPSAALFQEHGGAGCEWQLMLQMRERLGPEAAAAAIKAHRESFVTEEDIKRIKALGLNAVRIPFGYWIVTGPAEDDIFVGPGLEYLDRVLEWCQAHNLQVLLDLHGAPGGESGEKPCGRERKDWHWRLWRFEESLNALRVLAERYKGHPAVTGISVCNEPSETVPSEQLCEFYDRAVRAIREAGMPPDEVAVVIPVYRTERLDEVWRIWNRRFDGFAEHPNVAFDLHLYHCFGTWWQRQGLGNQLRMTRRHRKILRRVPAVVGEWSLALPPYSRSGDNEEDKALRTFASAQLEAYNQASHGWFFWNWRDGPEPESEYWDLGRCLERGWITSDQVHEAKEVCGPAGRVKSPPACS